MSRYTEAWLQETCRTPGGRAEVCQHLGYLDEIAEALMKANFCHNDDTRPLDHYELPYAVERLVEMWKQELAQRKGEKTP